MAELGIAPTVTVGGAALRSQWLDLLASVRIDLAIGLSGRTVLRFRDRGFALSTSQEFAMGVEVEVTAGGNQLMIGEVTGVVLEQGAGQTPVLVVTVDDKACRLNGSTKNRTFLNQTYSDVVRKIIGESGLSVGSVGATSPAHAYQLQAGSNLAFLNAICSRAGLAWWVEGVALNVVPVGTAGATVPLALGTDDLTSFSVRATNTGPAQVVVRGWNPDQQAVVSGEHTTSVTGESAFVAKAAGRATRPSRGATDVILAAPALDAGEAGTMARARFAEASSAAVVAKGGGAINSRIKLYDKVKIANAGPASGSYLVTGLEHVYSHSAGFRTHFTAGPVRPAGLVDLLGTPPPDSGMAVSGVLAALVTNLKDPDNKGRIAVKYSAVSEEVESAWARMVVLGAGKDRGMLFYPEVGDEVLIAFENGDTRRPVVLGGLFSAKNTLPVGSGTAVANNKIKYRRITSRLGHMVELADGEQPGEQHILLQHQEKKHQIKISGEEVEVISDGLPITLSNGQAKVVLAKNGDITLDGNNIEIKAKAGIKVTANGQVAVKGTAGTEVGGSTVKVKADGMASVEASGPLTLKGAMVAIN
ncbi:hypothetical protein FE634_18700 [Nocardioides dongxiaopingii]|uniref:phage baseplate assembly protein V n=1 Tax=Nocardioides sp. S-1144 TaxID=2582905 RepID=UPI00110EE847|nr:phage baseplate assembly protein V [Nocardioides sp. S-1144]QCW51925.1 hypothetical protein FE634_18700 [Nocardioides sp. S-1144]